MTQQILTDIYLLKKINLNPIVQFNLYSYQDGFANLDLIISKINFKNNFKVINKLNNYEILKNNPIAILEGYYTDIIIVKNKIERILNDFIVQQTNHYNIDNIANKKNIQIIKNEIFLYDYSNKTLVKDNYYITKYFPMLFNGDFIKIYELYTQYISHPFIPPISYNNKELEDTITLLKYANKDKFGGIRLINTNKQIQYTLNKIKEDNCKAGINECSIRNFKNNLIKNNGKHLKIILSELSPEYAKRLILNSSYYFDGIEFNLP